MRVYMIVVLLMASGGCGQDDAEVTQRNETPFPRFDAGALRPDPDASTAPRDTGAPPDAGWTSPDQGSPRSDTPTPNQPDGGTQQGMDAAEGRRDITSNTDAGTPVEPPRPGPGGAQLLMSRSLACDGERIGDIMLRWNQGQLLSIDVREFGEVIESWRITWRDNRPLSAISRNTNGDQSRARWAYNNGLLMQAQLTGDGVQLDWRFRYDERSRLVEARFEETVDGQNQSQAVSYRYGPEGPLAIMNRPITYANGRPATVGRERLRYQGDVLVGLPSGRLRYANNGLLQTLDEGQGCAFEYRYAPGQTTAFQAALPFSGLGAFYDERGRFHGRLDPGRWLYLILALLVGE
jgi:hypothetical protein